MLSKLEGVANVGVLGGEERQISVNIDRKKIEGFGLDVQQVLQAVENAKCRFSGRRG
jgi:HAE1 family hydrophobic/amphiphilic exporter-1